MSRTIMIPVDLEQAHRLGAVSRITGAAGAIRPPRGRRPAFRAKASAPVVR